MENKIRRLPTNSNLRGLGCGGKGAAPTDVVIKVCADCGDKVSAPRKELVCPRCGGPLGS